MLTPSTSEARMNSWRFSVHILPVRVSQSIAVNHSAPRAHPRCGLARSPPAARNMAGSFIRAMQEAKRMPAYWVARSKINDPVEYKKYTDRLPAIFQRYRSEDTRLN